MRARIALLSLVTCLLSIVAFAPPASATAYCLYPGTCYGVPANVRPATEAGLESAIAAATLAAGDDKIEVGHDTIDIDSLVNVFASSGNGLAIEGVGGADSVLRFTQASGSGLYIDSTGSGATGITNIKIVQDGTETGAREALEMTAGRATGVDFEVHNAGSFTSAGVMLGGGAECFYCSFKLVDDDAIGAWVFGNATIRNSEFREASTFFVDSTGVRATGAGTTDVRNSKFIELDRSLAAEGNTLNLRDSIVDMGDHQSAEGVTVGQDGNATGTSVANIDGVTFAGAGDSQFGVQVEAGTNIAAGEIASANVTNSLFKFTNNSSGDTICGDDGNYGVGSISIDHSLKMDAPQLNSGCTVTLGAGNRSSDSSAPADLFVNFDAGDLRLAPGSDAIDHGNSGTSHTDRGIDVFGGFRFVVGESGVDIIDMGAGEYQPYAPDRPTLQASATTVTVGQPINFTATATDGNEDALTYNWSFSEGTSSGNGATQSHTFTTVGEHFVEVWAHDGVYQSESSGKLLITVNPAPAPPSGGSTPVPTPKAAFGKQVGKFKPRKKGANGFKVSAKKVKDGYIPVVSSAKLQIKLSFEKPKGGYLVGGACKAKQGKTGSAKRCSLPLKGSQTLDLPAGTSYLAFAGKWNKKLLAPGKYTLVGVNPNMMPNRISMNVTVPKQGK